jgi:hypothetical protein
MILASELKIKMRGSWKTTRRCRRVVENVGYERISTVRHEREEKRQGCVNVRFFIYGVLIALLNNPGPSLQFSKLCRNRHF